MPGETLLLEEKALEDQISRPDVSKDEGEEKTMKT